jgi:hypothetical protein
MAYRVSQMEFGDSVDERSEVLQCRLDNCGGHRPGIVTASPSGRSCRPILLLGHRAIPTVLACLILA